MDEDTTRTADQATETTGLEADLARETAPETRPETKPEAETRPETKLKAETKAEPKLSAEDELRRDLGALAAPETEPETKAENKAETEQETKAENKAETKPESKPETAAAVDQFVELRRRAREMGAHLDGVAETNPSPQDWARLRRAYADAKAGASRPAQTQARAADGEREYSAEFLVEAIALHEGGDERVTDATRRQAEQALYGKDPAEVRDVLLKARQGQYGERSQEIAAVALEALPVVQAGWEQRAAEREARARAEADQAESMAFLLGELPELVSEDPAMAPRREQSVREVAEAARAIGGYLGVSEQLFRVVPKAPQMVAELVRLQRAETAGAQAAKRVGELEAEVATLKRQLAGRGQTMGADGRPPSAAKPKTAEQRLAEELAALGIARR